ncbi:S24/S26 family peptidase [Bacilliculturomica massiliensis]|uniref:hypothetical protein n=1 Tax=Bacilliculturomica massiliensis TaxID=1917867 RepID=UPI001032751F|nr:hypothetical protein [Bacilliculturomica massiliensis]
MKYAQMLDRMISDSELSLRQISKRCADLDLNITPSYISQLKNGKLPPPSEEVSLVLAKVCGGKDQSRLVFQGYLEKAPELVREYMLASSALNKIMLETLCRYDNNGEVSKEFRKQIESLDVLSTLEVSSKYVSSDDTTRAKDLIREITLASGEAVKADVQGELINFFLADSSMAPFIPSHAYLYIMPTKMDLLKDRDIIAFYPEGRRIPTLRRLFFMRGERYLLVPDDKSQQIYLYEEWDRINYIGKVVSFKVDL